MRGAWIALAVVGIILMTKKTNEAPKGIRNNNAGNIEYNKNVNWVGQIGDDGRFIVFSAPEYGIRAIARIISTYRTKHGINTIHGIINRWAPPVENDTGSYVNSVSQKTGIPPNQPLHDAQIPAIIAAIIHHENGQSPYDLAFIKYGVSLA
ncbi:MAG: hypothetical protein COA78_36780 [Blastopirellula sp.]|nr:MAG: hypothetical protein COA78_36780 [Blastopirellula sp.]